MTSINGELGIVVREHGVPLVVMSFDIRGDRIRRLRLMANPDKLLLSPSRPAAAPRAQPASSRPSPAPRFRLECVFE